MTQQNNVPAPTPGTVPALSADAMAKMAGAAHTTDFGAGQTLVPYVQIVQTMSPYMKRNHPSYIESAREGDIINTLTLRISAVRHFIPCKFEVHYTTWKPNNGPLVKQWFTDSSGYDALPGDYGAKQDADGNDISPTAVYYGLDYDPETNQTIASILSLGGTQFKKQRRWNSLTTMEMDGPNGPFIPPMFARVYDLTTRTETGGPNGDKSWAGWVIEPGLFTLALPHGDRFFEKASQFRKAIEEGKVRPAPPQERVSEEDGHPVRERGQGTGPTGAGIDEEIPF